MSSEEHLGQAGEVVKYRETDYDTLLTLLGLLTRIIKDKAGLILKEFEGFFFFITVLFAPVNLIKVQIKSFCFSFCFQ